MTLKVYSKLSAPEERQLFFKKKYKQLNSKWDDSQVILGRWFRKFLRPDLKILDLGCGQGNFVIDKYKKKIRNVVGVDISKKDTRKNKSVDNIVIADVQKKLPFAEGEFDLVLSLWTLEHLAKPEAALKEVYRVLKKGGIFLFVTPHSLSYLLLIKKIIGESVNKLILKLFYGRKEGVFKTYYRANTPADLKKLLAGAGFKKGKLFLNGDPSYLGFNDLFFKLGVLIDKLSKIDYFNISKVHILGAYVK